MLKKYGIGILLYFIALSAFAQEFAHIYCLQISDEGDVEIHWTKPTLSSGFESYEIFNYNETSGFESLAIISDFDQNSFTQQKTTVPVNLYETAGKYFIKTHYTSSGSQISDTVYTICLRVEKRSDIELKLSWNTMFQKPPSANEQFEVFMEYPEGNWQGIGQTIDSSWYEEVDVCIDSVNFRVKQSSTGCTSVSNIGGENIKDIDKPALPIFDSVSVTNDGYCILGWQKSPSLDLAGYRIQRERKTGGIIVDIAFIPFPDSLYFIDSTAHGFDTSYKYYITSYDRCGNTNGNFINFGQKNITISEPILETCDSIIRFDFSEYINMPDGLKHYNILCSKDGEELKSIAKLPPDQRTFEFRDLERNAEYCFKIRAESKDGWHTASSGTRCIRATLPPQPAYLDIPLASVRDNFWIDLSGEVDTSAGIQEYHLFRKEGEEGSFMLFDTIYSDMMESSGKFLYSDGLANPNLRSYSYFLQAIDSCGKNSLKSNTINSINLSAVAVAKDMTVALNWTDYSLLSENLEEYYIYRSINGEWETEPYAVTQENNFIDDSPEAGMIENQLRYVVGCPDYFNINGIPDTAWSNIKEVQQAFTGVYFPNAFTPRRDINKIFIPRYAAADPSFYEFMIFNRYGQTIFSTEDPAEGWDGTYQGNDVPCNMYVYYLKMKTPEGDFVERRGKVLLLD